MKYNIHKPVIAIMVGAGLLFSACSKDFLNRLPENAVPSEQFWNSAADIEKAVTGVYNQLGGDGIIYDAAMSDDAFAQYPWESSATVMSSGDVTTDLTGSWGFTDIRRANFFLDNCDKATIDAEQLAQYKAQVRFLRAWFYWDRVVKYGDYPLITTALEIDQVDVPRTPRAEVVDFLIKELDTVAAVLPVSYDAADNGRATKGAALALKARILLTDASPYFNTGNDASKWKAAADAAKAVMDLGTYGLYKVTAETGDNKLDNYSKWVNFSSSADESKFRLGLRSYEGLFEKAGQTSNEIIFQRDYIVQQDPNYLNTYLPPSTLGGWSSVTPTQQLVDAYDSYKTGEAVTPVSADQRAEWYGAKDARFYNEYKNRDPRFYATIMFNGSPWNALEKGYSFEWIIGGSNNSKTGYNFRKMVDPDVYKEQVDNYNNVILMRYAEILLSYAEAENEYAGPNISVYDALDQIRERAGMPGVDRSKYSSKESLRTFIRHERRIELALEGQRYLDIRRWKIAPQVMKTIYDLRKSPAQNRVWNDRLYYFPVPQKQIDLSNDILKQNPGYSSNE
ncbi:RagB/SusD family nutrient uptake outer membrane protein [Arachidicoccus terrestris]|uniref:RagB/SusD family nutrient uptake outer membrane protein n=1 Tax=Arachidicoccus terrestris TaxID=2875539 RepID=UPI001CC53DEA|nr:RagB/SusD family nutrient uptake outer membrane protein [Arachidicoccus terrestris]UAY55348.1 RagB/SusD family nutrient uptake outer membrane protein [Arachidicoccus terrestris]